MKPDLNLLLFFVFSLVLVDVSLPVEPCPPRCQCDWDVHSVSCFGAEAVPVFPCSTQEVYISDDVSLRYLERHSFHNLSSVTHMYDLPNLKYLGIINTGLASFPELRHIHSRQEDFILEIVENAFIQVIPANSFTGISDHALTIASIDSDAYFNLMMRNAWKL
ncbi:thyrotropin receptor-like [Solea senegalensis]|uniref:Thyrotropin receptor-like n=1 Tax=Solea senegalensis TaxID=28829 RepID=A0AAV6R0S9_SOLSE|nr:thyrotropin receptor-like [Solea senegalensis]